jgi:hypothetical protein
MRHGRLIPYVLSRRIIPPMLGMERIEAGACSQGQRIGLRMSIMEGVDRRAGKN